MNFRRFAFITASFLLCTTGAHAQIWRHSEIAGKNSLFAEVGIAPLVFELPEEGAKFSILPLELRVDYLPPLPLPFSVGLFMKTPGPNLKSFGTRIAYHFDLNMPKTDLYFAHIFDFGFTRNDLLEKYNDPAVEIHYYDFRVGVRHFFGSMAGLAIETDFKAGGVVLLLAIKIH